MEKKINKKIRPKVEESNEFVNKALKDLMEFLPDKVWQPYYSQEIKTNGKVQDQQGEWKNLKNRIRIKLVKLSDFDIKNLNEHMDQQPSKVQKAYSYTKKFGARVR
jgi:hypothetical protein